MKLIVKSWTLCFSRYLHSLVMSSGFSMCFSEPAVYDSLVCSDPNVYHMLVVGDRFPRGLSTGEV